MLSRNWWRFALVLLMVPVVAFGNPSTASATVAAATPVATDWIGATWKIAGIQLGPVEAHGADCGGGFSMAADSAGAVTIRTSGGYCIGMPDLSPFSCQIIESGCTDYSIKFLGSGCEQIGLLPPSRPHPDDSFSSVKSGWGYASAAALNCDPTQVCLEPFSAGGVVGGAAHECTNLELDPPVSEPDAPACAYGAARKPGIGAYGWPVGGTEYSTKGREIRSVLTDEPSGNWRVIAVTKGPPAYGPTANVTGETLGTELTIENLDTINAAVPSSWNRWARFAEWYGINAGKSGELVGVQFWREGVGTGPNWATVTGSNLGTTDPARCMYYYGDKIADATNTENDEPASPLTFDDVPVDSEGPPPPPPNGPEDVEPLPTVDTEQGFWNEVLRLLIAVIASVSRLAAAIGGLADAIGLAFKGALLAALVPDTLALADDIAGVVEDFKGTSLWKWGDAFTGQAVDMPGSGCSGVPVDLDLAPGVGIHENLGEACDGSMATAAALVKVLVSAQVIFFGGLACIRALGSGFGWSPGVGGRGEA